MCKHLCFVNKEKPLFVLTVCKSLFLSITAVNADTTHNGARASIAINFPNGSSVSYRCMLF